MPQPTKPGIPWAEIEQRYRSGEKAMCLATEYDVTRQGIEKRAVKEGWRGEQRINQLRQATAQEVAKAKPTNLDRQGLRNPENARLAIELAEMGATYAVIAARCGMTPGALNHWRDAEPDFNLALQNGLAMHAESRLGNVNDAAERGDARAAQWMLERNPLTRTEYGQAQSAGGPTLNVVINIPDSMSDLADMIDGGIIEGEASEA